MNAAAITALTLLLAGPASSNPADADGDSVMSAMRDELSRTKTLTLPESASPYYAAYHVFDVEAVEIAASFGSLIGSSQARSRMVAPTVRVGDYERDAMGFPMSDGTAPFEDDYGALRRRLWLSTDGAYKSAATNFREQQAQDKQKTRDADAPDAFAKHDAVVHLETLSKSSIDRGALEATAKAASEVFKAYPEIQRSGVSVAAANHHRRFASSEGSLIARGGQTVTISISALSQADDGSRVHSTRYLVGEDGKGPAKADVVAAAREVAEDLMAQRKAPALEDYTGPVLFEGVAAAQITAHMLGTRFAAGGWGADLEARMGQRVLPKGFMLVDDPTLTELDGTPTFGHYEIDDEGVPGQRVTLVDDGRLEALMSTRKPTKLHPKSNGHARGGSMGWTMPAPSNLMLTSKKGLSSAGLQKKLRAQMKREGLDYAIVVTNIGESPWSPAEAYRVDAKGKRERVRLGSMEPLQLRAFRDVLGAGKAMHRFDFLAMNGQPAAGVPAQMLGMVAPTTVASPSLLLREAVIHKNDGDKPKPPLYRHPHFANGR